MEKFEEMKTLESFIDYCKAHPKQRFWQALRNWSGADFIYMLQGNEKRDTFYFREGDDYRNM